MNKTTTMTMCVVMLMIGMAFTAVAATRSDSSGETSFSVSGVSNFGTYVILNETFVVVNDATQDYCGYQFTRTNVIIDMKDIPEMAFAGSNIAKLILTENVESVAENAFAKNRSLISVSRCGTGGLDIAADAFKDCTALKYIDLRGDVTVGDGAFPSDLAAMRAMDMDGEAPYASGDAVRVKDTGGEIVATMYDGSRLRVAFGGTGMLQLVDADNNRASYSTDASTFTTYMFTPFEGKDMTLGYRVVHIKYNLEDIPDVDAEIKAKTYTLVDLTGGVTPTTWLGWRDRVSSQYTVKAIDHAFIDRYCNNTGSVLDLVSYANPYTIYFNTPLPAEGEVLSSTPIVSGANGTTKYPYLDSEHYICVGWYRTNDVTKTVHPCGSYIRYFDIQTINAVWEPKAEFVYGLQYTNVDGTDLGEPESYGYAQKAAIKHMVPYDETPTQKIDGWVLEGSEDVLHEGDTVKITGDTKLYPVLKDRSDVTVTFDNGGSKQTMTVKDGYPTPITIENPKDTYRLFIGWTKAGTEWALMNGDEVTADADITLTPTWRDKQSFMVSYRSEGLQIGETLTVLETDEVRVHKDVTKANHRLSGWSDGTDVVEDGSDYPVTTNVTFTAVWTELEKHTVTYHLADGTSATKSAYAGSTVKVAADPGTRQGYDFLGWSTDEGPIAEYGNGDSLEVVGDIELYPVWMRNSDPLPEPDTGDSSDGSDSGGDTDAGDGSDPGDSSGDGGTTEGGDATEGGTEEPDAGDSTGGSGSEGGTDAGETGGDTSSGDTDQGDTDAPGGEEQQEEQETTPDPAPAPAPRPTPVYPIYPDYDDDEDDYPADDGDDEPVDEDTDEVVEPEPDGDASDDTSDDTDADDGTDGTIVPDASDDTPDDGSGPTDTGTDSDSGSGGSGIGTGAGIAALAAVSAMVAGFLVVALRRS